MTDVPPVARSYVRLDDLDRARTLLWDEYGARGPFPVGSTDDFALESASVLFDETVIGDLYYGSICDSEFAERPHVTVGHVSNGRLDLRNGGYGRSLGAGDLVAFDPGQVGHARTAYLRFDFVRFEALALDRVAQEISGIEPGSLRWQPGTPASAERVALWRATRRWVLVHVLADDAVAASPIIRREAFRRLAVASLFAVPNSALDRLTDPVAPAAGRAAPAVVRRAMAFMEAHAGEDVDIARIAEAAGIGPRGLQAAFRRHRDQTPLEYLRAVRMEGAHRDLVAGDPTRGDSVVAIAARWGFAHPGRFSVAYREVYACTPSHTLRH